MSEKHYSAFIALGLLSCILSGCGGGGGGDSSGTARATVLLSGGSSGRDAESNLISVRGSFGAVPLEDIESLTVTVTEVVLHRCEGGEVDGLETVLVEDFNFDPTSVSVEEGGTVRWVWTTDTLHTITSGAAGDGDAGSLFDESASTAGAVVELIFEDVGSFPYFSNTEADINEGMAGTVNVVEDDGEDDGEGGDQEGGHVTVFDGAFDVNILDLVELSQVLSAVDVPADDYCKMEIRIENPRLVLVSDPETELTNVHLTANGRLFIEDNFSIEPGVDVLIIVQFDSIHLVLAGNSGRYVFTPQLRAEVEVTDAAIELEGEIISVDPETQVVQVQTANDDVFNVFIDGDTEIATDDDSDDGMGEGEDPPTVALLFEDLAVGQNVTVQGLLDVLGNVLADTMEVADEDFDTTV